MKKRIITATILFLACIMLVGAPTATQAATWKKNASGWWYQNDDHTWPASQWKKIGGTWYYFNNNGYMTTGWHKVSGKWYYMNSSGAMQANKWIGNYYVTGSGAMATNAWVGKYYVGSNGKWIPNYQPAKWVKSSKGWWYRNSDGSWPASQWKSIDGKWYYFDASGYMTTGWQKVNNKWYYMYSNGSMASNTMVGDYYLGSDGAWVTHTHTWVDFTKTVNHPAVTHQEDVYKDQQVLVTAAWDEQTVVDCAQECLQCGFTTQDPEEMTMHAYLNGHSCHNIEIYGTVHHDAVYETKRVKTGTKTVVDKEAWTETVTGRKCSSCGKTE